MLDESAFDPYHKWLGIPESEQPPNHYRLLAIEEFENDPDVITHAADRCMAHVRTFQSGAYAELSQKILTEISAARVCLLGPESKSVYDAQLRQTSQMSNPAPPPAATPEPMPPTTAEPPPQRVPVGQVAPVPAAREQVPGPPVERGPGVIGPSAPAISAPAFGVGSSSPSVSVARRRARKKSSPAALLLLAVAGVLVVIIIVAVNLGPRSPGNRPATDRKKTVKKTSKSASPVKKAPRVKSGSKKPSKTPALKVPREGDDRRRAGIPRNETQKEGLTDGDLIAELKLPPAAPKPELRPKWSDPFPQVPANGHGEPIPDPGAQQIASGQIDEAFSEKIGDATTDEQKAALAREYFSAGLSSTDDRAKQYVLWNRAAELETKLADTEAFLPIIDRIAQVFQIDALERKSIRLNEAVEATLQAERHARVVEAAIRLCRQAEQLERYELALRLANTATTAARLARNPKAVIEMKAEREKIQRLMSRQLDEKRNEADLQDKQTPNSS